MGLEHTFYPAEDRFEPLLEHSEPVNFVPKENAKSYVRQGFASPHQSLMDNLVDSTESTKRPENFVSHIPLTPSHSGQSEKLMSTRTSHSPYISPTMSYTNHSPANLTRNSSFNHQHYSTTLRSPPSMRGRGIDVNSSHYPHISRPRTSSDSQKMYTRAPVDYYYVQENPYFNNIDQDSISDKSLPSTNQSLHHSEEDTESDNDFSESIHPEFDIDVFYKVSNILYDESDLQDPEKRERLEWHSMLSSVLKGDVMQTEKRRLRLTEPDGHSGTYISEVWLGLQAWLHGRLNADQAEVIRKSREGVEPVLREVIDFQIQDEETTKPPLEQVTEILEKVEQCKQFYISSREMEENVPLSASKEFNYKLNALISWSNVMESIQVETLVLQKWVGNDEFDLTMRTPQFNYDGVENTSSFVERIFRQSGLQRTFEQRTLTTLNRIIHQAKQTISENAQAFEEMKLPTYEDKLLPLVRFPIKLLEEALRLRLAYAKKIKGPNFLIVDSMLDDFKIALSVAVRIKREYIKIASPSPGWSLPTNVDEDYDNVLLDSLKFYFKLLTLKLSSGNKNLYFKEIDFLENEWAFLNEHIYWINGGDIHMAGQFSYLSNSLLLNVHRYVESHLNGPTERTAASLTNWYSTLLKNTQIRFRKILRFSETLNSRFENASDFVISEGHLPDLVNRLSTTGHFLAYTANLERDGVFVIADHTLSENPEALKALLFSKDISNLETIQQNCSYVLILCPVHPIVWKGRIEKVDVPDFSVDLKTNRVRIIASNKREHLQAAKSVFQSISGDLVTLAVECRSSITRVYKEFIRLSKLCMRISSTVVDCVSAVREACSGVNCHDLIYHVFSFAAEFGQRILRFLSFDSYWQTKLKRKITSLAVEWISFICDECDLMDRKTFRWGVGALEFLMLMIRGNNILLIDDAMFLKIREKVGKSMALLLTHFDVLGAKSKVAAKLQRESTEVSSSPRLTSFGDVEEEALSIQLLQKETMLRIDELEIERNNTLLERLAIGHVLDDSVFRNRDFIKLASSFSNITIRWQQGHFVRSGMFGDVYTGVNMETGDLLAVKEIKLQDSRTFRSTVDQIHNEMTVLERLNHPNVVTYYGVEVHREKVYIFMEFCQGGSLADLLAHGRIEDENVLKVYVVQLLEGLAYIHSQHILHRDIKPANILLDHRGMIKYSDFGSALYVSPPTDPEVRYEDIQPELQHLAGTPMYMAPEIILGTKKGDFGAMDIWSLGCVILEMMTGSTPWSEMDNEWAIMYHVAAMHTPSIPQNEKISSLARDFIEQCFERDPEQRPRAVDLLTHPWITDFRKKTIITMPPTTITKKTSLSHTITEEKTAQLLAGRHDDSKAETDSLAASYKEESALPVASNVGLRQPNELRIDSINLPPAIVTPDTINYSVD